MYLLFTTSVDTLQRYCAFLLVGLALLNPVAASARTTDADVYDTRRITDAEWKILPVYCADTQGIGKYGKNGSPNSAKWVAMMGETFWHLHHYCLGLLEFQRAGRFGVSQQMRSNLLVSATGNFLYVTERMPENYVLAPEILTYLGRTYLDLGKGELADAAFERARRMKPDYWPAYSWWATYLANQGKSKEARSISEEGLRYSPNSRTLEAIVRDLDSKKGEDGPARSH